MYRSRINRRKLIQIHGVVLFSVYVYMLIDIPLGVCFPVMHLLLCCVYDFMLSLKSEGKKG
jgi:hypothetical protein